MTGFKILFCNLLFVGIVAAASDTKQEVVIPDEIGVLIVSETKHFNKKEILISNRTIMKKGNKVRIDETAPMPSDSHSEQYEEAKTVTISDGKTAWLLSPNGRETLKPITDLREYLGVKYSIKDEEESEGDTAKVIQKDKRKWYVDKTSHCVLKEEHGKEEIVYKNYELIEGIGLFPRTIERYHNGKLRVKTQVKRIDMFREFSNALFDPEQIKFPEQKKQRKKSITEE